MSKGGKSASAWAWIPLPAPRTTAAGDRPYVERQPTYSGFGSVSRDGRTPSGLPSLLSGFGLLALALHGRLLVVRPPLHFLEHTALQHLPLEGLQGGLDLIVEDLDPQRLTFPTSRGPPWSRVHPSSGTKRRVPRHRKPSGLRLTQSGSSRARAAHHRIGAREYARYTSGSSSAPSRREPSESRGRRLRYRRTSSWCPLPFPVQRSDLTLGPSPQAPPKFETPGSAPRASQHRADPGPDDAPNATQVIPALNLALHDVSSRREAGESFAIAVPTLYHNDSTLGQS